MPREFQCFGANVCGAGCQISLSLFGEGVSCSYKSVKHQDLAVNCTNIRQLLRYFKNWGEKHNLCLFTGTRVLTALMPHIRELHRTD